jgi:hypothetical protein
MILSENEKVIKQLSGFSGSSVYLLEDLEKVFVRKINNIDRNFERMLHLSRLGYNIPRVYYKDETILDIEYIPGLDIKTYLRFNQIDKLTKFLVSTIASLSSNSIEKDYTSIYEFKLSSVDFSLLPFSRQELIDKLPKVLPKSNYYGDLTLENILYGSNNQFYLIDPVTIEYDSWMFDIAKLRQDLQCKWFIRNDNLLLDTQLNLIQTKIFEHFPESNNDYLLILMLLRVYNHAILNSLEHKFLLGEIQKLWK